jgi:thiamine-monophosphate kinase
LLGDLGHILAASRVGAVLTTDWILKTRAYRALLVSVGADFLSEKMYPWVLTGGDDYELVFTAPVAQRDAVLAAGANTQVALTRIGYITAEPELVILDAQHQPLPDALVASWRGFDHFAHP